MLNKRVVLAVVAATLSVGVLAFAVPGRPEPGGDHHRGPDRHRKDRGGPGHGMFGRFLKNPKIVEKLGLSDGQVESLHNLRYEAMKRHIDLKAAVSTARLDVRHLLHQDAPDEGAVMAAIERAGEASVDLRKSDVSHMLKGRSIIGPDKWKQVRQLMAERRHRRPERGHRRGRHGREHGPEGETRGPRGSRGPEGPEEDREEI